MLTILVHTLNQFCIDSFKRTAKENSVKCVFSSDIKTLFEYCSSELIDGYVISAEFEYTQRAINTIRALKPNAPIVSMIHPNTSFILRENIDLNYLVHGVECTDPATKSILSFIELQGRLYSKLEALTPTKLNEIYFGEGFKYEVVYREFYLNNIALRRFSTKEGKLLEILSRNYGKIVKRDSMLEEAWHSTDIYSSRSFDVYISKLRNFFREYDLKLKIRNISGVGLILE